MTRSGSLLAGLAAVAALVVVACSYSLDVPPCKISCQSQAECPSDHSCRSGFCQQGSTDRCARDAVAADSTPVADSAPDTRPGPDVGVDTAPAGGCNTTCAAGTVCCPAGERCAGMCVGDCRLGGCATGEVCNQGGFCQPRQNTCGGQVCTSTQVCCPSPLGCMNTCVPDCRKTGPCPQQNLTCNQTTGVCSPPGM